MTHGSLFAGIGGFDLGFERAGIKTVWQVEIEDYCRRVLARHFPDARRFSDIRDCGKHNLALVDILSGGFPCQDISNAGKRAGIDGERSGLWSEYARIIRELRPRYVVVENVAALLGRGMERVLGDLAESGYDAEWQSISAADVGAPHRRERIWILAYRQEQTRLTVEQGGESMANATCERTRGLSIRPGRPLEAAAFAEWRSEVCDSGESQSGPAISWGECNRWTVEPNVGRVAHGIPARVDRLKGLGNAIVPQIAEWIGRRIVEATD